MQGHQVQPTIAHIKSAFFILATLVTDFVAEPVIGTAFGAHRLTAGGADVRVISTMRVDIGTIDAVGKVEITSTDIAGFVTVSIAYP